MKDKQTLLAELNDALDAGVLTKSELLRSLGVKYAEQPKQSVQSAQNGNDDKLSAIEVMFYIAGIVLFAAIMSLISQTWKDGSMAWHIFLSAGIGMSMWACAYYLAKTNPARTNDIRTGLESSLLLTGSLLLIVGGYIISNEATQGFGDLNLISGAVTLAILGAIHIGFDRLLNERLVLLMGTLLSVATFPALILGMLENSNITSNIVAAVMVFSAGLLAAATRVIAKLYPNRKFVERAFDSLAGFIALASMFLASFGNYGVVWQIVLIASILGIFYVSIVTQSKQLLGLASVFLVLTIISMSFRYFSGYGITFSLIIATMGILGTAAVASAINKKYFIVD